MKPVSLAPEGGGLTAELLHRMVDGLACGLEWCRGSEAEPRMRKTLADALEVLSRIPEEVAKQEPGPLGMTQIPVATLGKMHDRIAALEAIARRYRWLTARAYVGECFTHEGVVLEIHNTDRRVPISGPVDEAIDAALRSLQSDNSKEKQS